MLVYDPGQLLDGSGCVARIPSLGMDSERVCSVEVQLCQYVKEVNLKIVFFIALVLVLRVSVFLVVYCSWTWFSSVKESR